MSGNTFGTIFKVTTFGESHGAGLGVIIDGCPAGITINQSKIQAALDKRRPGAAINGIKTAAVTQRNEPDQAEILSGVFEEKSEGTPISIIIRNFVESLFCFFHKIPFEYFIRTSNSGTSHKILSE